MALKGKDKLGDTPQERIAAFEKSYGIFFWKPYPWQAKAVEKVRTANTMVAVSSNKLGKTAFGANIVISWALGYEPWNPTFEGDPDGMEPDKGGIWYKKSSLGIEPPVNIIIAGEDWKLHLGKTIVPELIKWAPQGWYTTRKNEQGVDYYWEWENKSTYTLMSYSQDDALFESFRAQGAWEDEPPPKTKHNALSRGLLLDNGKTLMTFTPLKEAWTLDEIVLSGRKDIAIMDGLKITDNPALTQSDIAVLSGMGLDKEQMRQYFRLLLYENFEKRTPVRDRGYAAERFLDDTVSNDKIPDISNLKMLKFIKDIDPDDVPPRVFGQFKSLVGRVLKQFDENIHKIKRFDVPTDWPVVVMIDFHLSTPQAVSYWTVNRQEINYCIGETWENLSADGIADDIVRKIKWYGWKIEKAFIDPLSKGDTAYMRNALGTNLRSTFETLEERLSEHGITLYVASKDKDSGIKNIQTWLKGPNGMPTCYVFEDCERHLYEVKRWVFDEDGKPTKASPDHFMENWYRYTLTGNRWEDAQIKPLPARVPMGAGSWMGA